MRVRMLGTGSSDGWPNPWCGCVSCRAAREQGVVRGQTSALVDGRLLLDIGQDAPRAAERLGESLQHVAAVLVSHNHPDHHGPEAWMWRGWAPTRRELVVVAPPAVLAAARPRFDDTVRPVSAAPGDELDVAGYRVRVLAAHHGGASLGPPVLYDVTAPDGTALLWGLDTGPLPEATLAAVAGRDFALVLLELTSAPIPVHLDLGSWPEQVAALRRVGAMTGRTRLAAVHLGHGNPPPDELDRQLAQWGAVAPRDGDELVLPAPTAGSHRPAGRVLVLGGARSGKSAYAEQLVAAEPQVTYVATAPDRPGDAEWEARVAAHRARRPAGWTTLETGDVAGALGRLDHPVLVDDLGLWLTARLDAAGWSAEGVAAACGDLLEAWTRRSVTTVLVTPDVGGGVVPSSASGRLFRDLLGALSAQLAARSDRVVQVVAGLPRELR